MYLNDLRKINWLIESFEKEFSTQVKKEIISNKEILHKLSQEVPYLVQIVKLPQTKQWFNGTHTDHYQVNFSLYLDERLSKIIAKKMYHFLKNTLAGVDAGDLFFNISQNRYYNYWFRLLVQEGV